MKRQYTERFNRSYAEPPTAVRKAFQKQIDLLISNLCYPSLQAKKIDETNGVWQACVDRSWRFLFQIVDDNYIILDIFRHPK